MRADRALAFLLAAVYVVLTGAVVGVVALTTFFAVFDYATGTGAFTRRDGGAPTRQATDGSAVRAAVRP